VAAQQVEAIARARYADGTAWCDLSTVEHEVVDLVPTVVGVRPGRGGPPRRALLDTLRSRQALLILDNAAERLARATVAKWLAERLGDDRFARAGRRGAAMPADAVIAYADGALSTVDKR
jgi:hypothetical protein